MAYFLKCLCKYKNAWSLMKNAQKTLLGYRGVQNIITLGVLLIPMNKRVKEIDLFQSKIH